ncbi:peptidase A24A prepilin type IV [Paenibacillus algicola]|uniref:Peptidase A24A prepilin type IV n=1 Tax=Paenibacillus algicola TaxID=2565926 RepID=A0A4P8XNH3_9BACL|nr:A24 family peptidase [Paenibacillus algicola]QCT03983.1 peptidase A24A prepilin type IV [Paenibacillus algicola]
MNIAFWMCAVFLAAAFVMDLRYMRIPNMLTVPSALLGLGYHGVTGGVEGVLFSLQGMAAGFGIVLVMYLAGAVGAGDVKLFGAIGAWCGLWFTIQGVFYSVFCAGIIGLCIVIWRREVRLRFKRIVFQAAEMMRFKAAFSSKQQGGQLRFPFMLAVLPGMLWTYFAQM